jgi:hypothetical protein
MHFHDAEYVGVQSWAESRLVGQHEGEAVLTRPTTEAFQPRVKYLNSIAVRPSDPRHSRSRYSALPDSRCGTSSRESTSGPAPQGSGETVLLKVGFGVEGRPAPRQFRHDVVE